MKKLTIVALVVVLVVSCLVFTGCGKKEDKKNDQYEIALVTDVGNIDDKSFNQGTWEGVEAYAKEHNISYNYYKPSEDSTAAPVETMKTAIETGAKVVVCPGYLFEEAVYQMQTQYPEVQFLLIDGEPHDANYTYKTEKNVHCILFQEEQSGYFAGYAAVMDGYRKLGFLGGMDVDAVIRYGYGFVQGANDAAKKLGVEDDVTIKYWYSGSFSANDEIKTKMEAWYSEGTEVVFSCGGGIYLSAVSAAEAANGKVIGVDVDQSAESKVIITSAMKELKNSVILALGELYSSSNKKWTDNLAGKTSTLGAKDNCVGLPTATESWRLTKFTVEDYKKLFDDVKAGTVSISKDTKTAPKTSIKVDYQN